jgi:hypothetical protein
LCAQPGQEGVQLAGQDVQHRVDQDAFVEGLQPVLTPEQVAKAVMEVAEDSDSAAEYQASGARSADTPTVPPGS